MTTWKDNADSFRDLDAGDGWAFARLVACSVKPDAGNPSVERSFHAHSKTSAREFATEAKTSHPRVLRFLDAWDAAAAAGWCVHSDDLTPADATTTAEPDVPWKARNEQGATIKAGGLYDSRTGLAGSKPESDSGKRADVIRKQAEQDGTGPSKAIDIASNPKALAAAIKADPATAEAAAKALAQSSHPVYGKPSTTPEGTKAKEALKAANTAAKRVTLVLGEAARLMKQAREAYDEIGSDLDGFDRAATNTALSEIVVQAESLRMDLGLDAEVAK